MCKDIDKAFDELEMSAEELADQTVETAADIKDTVTAEAEQAARDEAARISEEAARIAKNAGLLYWYKTAHSASVSYRKLKNNTLSARWDEISGCSPEQVAEVKARLDKYESGN